MKVTVNDKDYYTDDFTGRTKMQLFNQIQTSQQLMALPFQHALEVYASSCTRATLRNLAASLEAPVEV